MNAFCIMLKNVIVFVALAIPGYLLVRTNKLKKEQSGALSMLLMYVGMPFLIFSSTINNVTFNKELILTICTVALIGTAYTFLMFFLSKPLTQMEKEEKTRSMMRFAAVFSNNGFLGIPLAKAVFGDGSGALMIVIILNIVTNVLLYTLGIYLVSGDEKAISFKKALLNPVVIAFAIGIVANLTDVKGYVPEVASFSNHFSNIVTPISMTILGMKLGDVKFSELFTSRKLYYVSALKLIASPVVIVAAVLLVSKVWSFISADMILGIFVAFAMPTAGLSSTFADSFGGDTKSAVTLTLGTTMLSILTIPLLYWGVCMLL